MELVDVPDSKSGVGNYVPVRPRPSANKKLPIVGVFLYKRNGSYIMKKVLLALLVLGLVSTSSIAAETFSNLFSGNICLIPA